MSTSPGRGADGFVAGLKALGVKTERRGQVLVYVVEPVDGPYAGQAVETGVEETDLRSWPASPPHWVHLPTAIQFRRTNAQRSPLAGWNKHSRSIRRWGNAEPVRAWLAHARTVIGEAS